MKIGYKRYLSFLINGLQRSYDQNLLHITQDLEFDFKEYVLSQMHLGIVCHLYNRSLYTINSVFRHLDFGEEVENKKLYQVLSWFYYDLAMFTRSISSAGQLTGVKLSIEVSLDLEKVILSFDDEKVKVLKAIKSEEITEYSDYLDLKYREMGKFETLFLSDLSLDRFIFSIILTRFSTESVGKILEIGGVVPCC